MSNVQEQPRPEDQRQASPSAQAQTGSWPTTGRPPSAAPDFLILFHGLFCFARNDSYGAKRENVSEIGVHTKAPDHQFAIGVYEYQPPTEPGGAATETLLYVFAPDQARDVPGREIIIDVSQPTISGASYFEGGNGDPRNWSLVPDLEGPNFYNRALPKNPKALGLRLIIKHGLFYSVLVPKQQGAAPPDFDRIVEEAQNQRDPIGKVAYFAATELAHGPGGNVSIQFGRNKLSNKLTLQATGGRKYFIFFLNACGSLQEDDDTECAFDPTNPIKERRNDFHLYRKVFKLREAEQEYGLILRNSGVAPATAATRVTFSLLPLTQDIFSLDLLQHILSNPEAPCGSTSFGQTGGGFGNG